MPGRDRYLDGLLGSSIEEVVCDNCGASAMSPSGTNQTCWRPAQMSAS